MISSSLSERESAGHGWFSTTHWSVVLDAQETRSGKGSEALNKLCETYWRPVNEYIRRVEQNTSEADDLTQQFFANFLAKGHFQRADPHRGKFRTFLLTSTKNFLVNEWKRKSAQKRGGGAEMISLNDVPEDGAVHLLEPREEITAELIYEKKWALALLSRVRSRLEQEHKDRGKGSRFAVLERFLPGEANESSYGEVAASLGIAEGTLKSEVFRLKQRYGQLLREEVANTVSSEAEVEEELRHLIGVFS
jgi:RNA polymerase sigma factor (sigma-70 family)